MNDTIIVRPEKCVGCHACVRACPAPEANITKILDNKRSVTMVDNEHCIACGECVKVCNHGARDYLADTDACMTRIAMLMQSALMALRRPGLTLYSTTTISIM